MGNTETFAEREQVVDNRDCVEVSRAEAQGLLDYIEGRGGGKNTRGIKDWVAITRGDEERAGVGVEERRAMMEELRKGFGFGFEDGFEKKTPDEMLAAFQEVAEMLRRTLGTYDVRKRGKYPNCLKGE